MQILKPGCPQIAIWMGEKLGDSLSPITGSVQACFDRFFLFDIIKKELAAALVQSSTSSEA